MRFIAIQYIYSQTLETRHACRAQWLFKLADFNSIYTASRTCTGKKRILTGPELYYTELSIIKTFRIRVAYIVMTRYTLKLKRTLICIPIVEKIQLLIQLTIFYYFKIQKYSFSMSQTSSLDLL